MYELQQSAIEPQERSGTPAVSFAVGALVGAGIALLLTPAPGRDIRRRLGTTAQKVGAGAKDVIAKARSTMEGVRDDARVAMERGKESFQQSRHPETVSGWRPQTG